ncbi:MAG: hypothetical protein NVS4B12_15600 [Ktedonobacteraceae bacterium]
MRRTHYPPLSLLFLLFVLTGCQFAQSAFTRTASNAGSAFAAAATTLTYAHTGKLTMAYTKASFESYQSELNGIDQQLPSQQGTPDTRTVQHLLALYKTAMQAINQPCLEATCNWHAQVTALDQASSAFLKASGQ